MRATVPHLLQVGMGPHALAKHAPLVRRAFGEGLISGYSIIELESIKSELNHKLDQYGMKPEEVFLLSDRRSENVWFTEEAVKVMNKLSQKHHKLCALISTEPKAHHGYLNACLDLGIHFLVDKPLTAPVSTNGFFLPDQIVFQYENLLAKAKNRPGHYSIMSPRRYQYIYKLFFRFIKSYVQFFKTPITYFSVYHGAGVHNRLSEVLVREDHPYKYGYGMLMHSGYHYVDLTSLILGINNELFGVDELPVHIQSVSADPLDRVHQSPMDKQEYLNASKTLFGEVDFCSLLQIKHPKTRRVVTLGNINLIQSSVSVRNWKKLPHHSYNKNGRCAVEVFQINVGFYVTAFLKIFKVPQKNVGHSTQFAYEYEMQVHRGAYSKSTLPYKVSKISGEERPKRFNDLSDAKWSLLSNWLKGEEKISQLYQHHSSIKLLQRMLLSKKD